MSIVVCRTTASDSAYVRTLHVAQEEAKRRGDVIYLFEADGHVLMDVEAPEHHKWIARCWPGGRTEISGRLAAIKRGPAIEGYEGTLGE